MHIAQCQHKTLVGRKCGKTAFDQFAQLHLFDMRLRAGGCVFQIGGVFIIVDQIIEAVRGFALAGAEQVITGIGDDANDPALETAALKGGDGAIGFDKAILNDIGGGRVILQRAIRDTVRQILIGEYKLIERSQVAGHCLRDGGFFFGFQRCHDMIHVNWARRSSYWDRLSISQM